MYTGVRQATQARCIGTVQSLIEVQNQQKLQYFVHNELITLFFYSVKRTRIVILGCLWVSFGKLVCKGRLFDTSFERSLYPHHCGREVFFGEIPNEMIGCVIHTMHRSILKKQNIEIQFFYYLHCIFYI